MLRRRLSSVGRSPLRAKGLSFSLVLGLYATFVLSVFVAGCGGGGKGGTTPTPPTDTSADLLVEKRSERIDPQKGGQVALSNGAVLTIPQGAIPTESTVTLSLLNKPKYFGESAVAYDIQGLGSLTGTAKLSVPVGKSEKPKEEVSIFIYDETPIAGEPFQVKELDFEYDATTEKATVDIAPPSKQSRSRILERLRILVQLEPYYSAKGEEKLLPVPYYEQAGNSCWAGANLMLVRAFNPEPPGFHIGRILTYVGVSDDDFGIGTLAFQTTMLQYLAIHSKATVKWRGYASPATLKFRMLRELDAGHPLILRMAGHVVLVVGYRDFGRKFVLHDPMGVTPPTNDEGGAYTVRSLEWIHNQRPYPLVALQVAWVEAELPSNRTLQTIGCPGADEKGAALLGEMRFHRIELDTGREKPYGYLQFRPSAVWGYAWLTLVGQNPISEMPSETTKLSVKVPVWNASREPASVKVKVSLYTGSACLKTWESATLDLPSATDNNTVKREVATDIELGPPGTDGVRRYDLADANGIQKVNIDVRLLGTDGSYRDSFYLDVNLSLRSVISKVEPTKVAAGSDIIINGACFGDKKSTQGGVLLNGKALQIISWSDRKIVAKAPDYATSGDLVVTTGERYRYMSNRISVTVMTTSTVKKPIKDTWDYNLREFDRTLYDENWNPVGEIKFDVKAKFSMEGEIEAPAGSEFTEEDNPAYGWKAYNVKIPESITPVKVVATIRGLTASNSFIEPESGFKDNGAPPGSDGYGYVKYSVKRYELVAKGPNGQPIDQSICTINITEPNNGVYRVEFEVDATKLYSPGTAYRVTLELWYYYDDEVKHPNGKPASVRSNVGRILRTFHFHIYR